MGNVVFVQKQFLGNGVQIDVLGKMLLAIPEYPIQRPVIPIDRLGGQIG